MTFNTPDHPDVEKYSLEVDDLLFNRTNSYELVGKTAIVREHHAKRMIYASYLIRVRLLRGDALSQYVCYYLNSIQGRNSLLSMVSQQVGQANINAKKLRNVILPLPPEKEVRAIAEILNRLRELEDRIHESTDVSGLIEATKSAILSKAFRGQLGTNNPGEESSLELLKEVLSKKAR